MFTRPEADATPPKTELAAADPPRSTEPHTVPEDGPAMGGRLLRPVTHSPAGGERAHDANPGEKKLSPSVATMSMHGVTRLLTFDAA